MNILVVEDANPHYRLIHDNLMKAGHTPSRQSEADSAFEWVVSKLGTDEQINLVIADIVLRGDDNGGLILCRRLREDDRTRRLPIIILTSRDDDAALSEANKLGVGAYLTKPFQPRDLVSSVTQLLSTSNQTTSMP